MEPIVLFISAVSVLYCIIVTIRTRAEKEKDQEHQKRPKEEISQTSIYLGPLLGASGTL